MGRTTKSTATERERKPEAELNTIIRTFAFHTGDDNHKGRADDYQSARRRVSEPRRLTSASTSPRTAGRHSFALHVYQREQRELVADLVAAL